MNKNNNLKNLQKEEAIRRIKKLTKSFDLSPNILEDYKENKISCTIGNYIFNIGVNSKIEELIKRFEKENDALAYYCIVYEDYNELKMAILYVNDIKEDWKMDREYMVSSYGLLRTNTYVYSLLLPSFRANYESITLSSTDGVLVKVD